MINADGSEKSSRSKADYFELLIAEGLAEHYEVDKSFKEPMKELRNVISCFEDGENRIAEQEAIAKKTLYRLINFLTEEGILSIKGVNWIGRQHQTEHTLSDVDIITKDNYILGISLKSVRSGTGTQKNLGLDSVKNFLSIDIETELDVMWIAIRKELEKNGLGEIAKLPKSQIKEAKYDHPIIQKIGKTYGLPVQKKSVLQSVTNFNALAPKEKARFLKCIYGIEQNKKLINVVSTQNKIDLYWNDKYNAMVEGRDLMAKQISDKSYCIEYKGTPILRVQASFTNGVGISAFCQRAFLIDFGIIQL